MDKHTQVRQYIIYWDLTFNIIQLNTLLLHGGKLGEVAPLVADHHPANSTTALILTHTPYHGPPVFVFFLTNLGRRLLTHSVIVEQPWALQLLSNALLSTPPNAHFNLSRCLAYSQAPSHSIRGEGNT